MLSDNGGNVHTRTGIVASRLKRPNVLRICPICHQEQIRLNAEPCWQRLFQVTGVQVCPEHRVLLCNTPVPYVPFNKHEYAAVPRSLVENDEQPGFSPPDFDKLVLVATDMQQLLRSDFPVLGHAHWTVKYWQLLSGKGLTKGNNMKQSDLHVEFANFWGTSVLRALSCQIDVKGEHSWLAAMARKHRTNFHPLMHILIYRFLAGENTPLAELFMSCSEERRKTCRAETQQQGQAASEEDRGAWLKLQKQYPDHFAKELRQYAPALYMRLYRQDQKWLLANTPQREQAPRAGRRIDWQRRDRKTAREIVREGKRCRQNDVHRRISRRLLAGSARRLSMFEKYPHLLPITEKALRKYSESTTEYQRRRIDRAVAILRQNGERVVSWKIYRMANLRPNIPLEVKQYIRERVDETV